MHGGKWQTVSGSAVCRFVASASTGPGPGQQRKAEFHFSTRAGIYRKAILTVELDGAVGFPEGIFSDTLVRSEIGLAHNLDAQLHHHFVRVVYQNWFVFATYRAVVPRGVRNGEREGKEKKREKAKW